VIHQDTPHHLRRDSQKMLAISPGDLILPDQPHVRFVNQSRGLQAMIGPLPPKVVSRQAAKLIVYQGHQTLVRGSNPMA
jgi:hypothetical protein